jgi:hypothetical protein
MEYDETKIATETIKWTPGVKGAAKNEIVSPILTKFGLGNIVVHCLTVMHKIDAHIGNHRLVYGCISPYLLLPHVVMRDTILIDHPLATQDKASFQQANRHFIAVHTTDEDCHELLGYIHSVAKPRKMDVQTYYICLCELNRQVDWLPGNNLPLIEDQLHQACFDSMPTPWKEQYENAGHSMRTTPQAKLLRFFRMQQKAANCSQWANELKQHHVSRTHGHCHSDCAVTRV